MKLTEKTKIFINQYGIFYEGQILDNYDRNGLYIGQIQLKKFFIHYKKINKFVKIPKLYFSMSRINKTLNFTLSAEQLGIYYKVPQTRRNKPKK